MRRSSGGDDSFDWRFAADAGLAFAAVDAVYVLKFADAAVRFDEISQRRSAVVDRFTQDAADAGGEARPKVGGNCGCQRVRVNPCVEQGFVAVNIAKTGDSCLIQQDGFDSPLSRAEA